MRSNTSVISSDEGLAVLKGRQFDVIVDSSELEDSKRVRVTSAPTPQIV